MCAYVNLMTINLIGGRKDLVSASYRHCFHSIDLTSHRDLLNLEALSQMITWFPLIVLPLPR